ncbi:MAG: DUF1330 domain-containing protein [Sedimentitalea sp.]
MSVTVVAMVSINDDEPRALAEYFQVTGPLLRDAGAKIVKRFHLQEVVVGQTAPKSVIIVEYPSTEAVSKVFHSDAYRQIEAVRDRAFSQYSVTVVSDEESMAEPLALVD